MSRVPPRCVWHLTRTPRLNAPLCPAMALHALLLASAGAFYGPHAAPCGLRRSAPVCQLGRRELVVGAAATLPLFLGEAAHASKFDQDKVAAKMKSMEAKSMSLDARVQAKVDAKNAAYAEQMAIYEKRMAAKKAYEDSKGSTFAKADFKNPFKAAPEPVEAPPAAKPAPPAEEPAPAAEASPADSA